MICGYFEEWIKFKEDNEIQQNLFYFFYKTSSSDEGVFPQLIRNGGTLKWYEYSQIILWNKIEIGPQY